MKSTDTPLVSILINNYNYGDYVREAIDSALNQTYQNIEVIVVDDGSTDHSVDTIKSYGERIVPIIKENGGQASAFNVGFSAAKGDLICFLDSDDLFHLKKVEKIIEFFREYPEHGWLIHRMNHINPVGEEVKIAEEDQKQYLLKETGDYREEARRKKVNFILPATSALVFRRGLLEKIFPVPQALRITADNYLKFASLMNAPVIVCDEVLSSQRIHGNNLYTNQDRNTKAFRKKQRSINYHIARGLWNIDKQQNFSLRMALGVGKSALIDLDVQDIARATGLAFQLMVNKKGKV